MGNYYILLRFSSPIKFVIEYKAYIIVNDQNKKAVMLLNHVSAIMMDEHLDGNLRVQTSL